MYVTQMISNNTIFLSSCTIAKGSPIYFRKPASNLATTNAAVHFKYVETVLLKFLWLLKKTPIQHMSGFLCMPWEVYGESPPNLRMIQYPVEIRTVLCNGIPNTRGPGLNRVQLHPSG